MDKRSGVPGATADVRPVHTSVHTTPTEPFATIYAMGDVRDRVHMFYEDENGWIWERRDVDNNPVGRSRRSWRDRVSAVEDARREARWHGGRVVIGPPPKLYLA
jgi:hypothetical protein